MNEDTARRKAVAVLEELRKIIKEEFPGELHVAADVFGVSRSTFYRLMEKTPEKIDAVFLSQCADWLHDNRGREDFAGLWRRVTRDIH